jgi:hypothetical protein
MQLKNSTSKTITLMAKLPKQKEKSNADIDYYADNGEVFLADNYSTLNMEKQ